MKTVTVWTTTIILMGALVWALPACQSSPKAPEAAQNTGPRPVEHPVMPLKLADGPLADRNSEISGLAWFGDHLVILPQYPERFEGGPDGVLFTIPRDQIEAAASNPAHAPLAPRPLPLDAGGLQDRISGFEGYEALTFVGQKVYATIETSDGMTGRMVMGEIEADASAISWGEPQEPALIKPQADLGNQCYEALLATKGGELVTFYEANGQMVNATPQVIRFDGQSLASKGSQPMAALDYRLTDVTDLDDQGRFWALNYFWPGNKDIMPPKEALSERYGLGVSHLANEQVERLVEFEYDPAKGVTRVDRAPILLRLEDEPRNWEGLVRLGDRGFVLATDKFPRTILGFVER